jgi:hypothetical protein
MMKRGGLNTRRLGRSSPGLDTWKARIEISTAIVTAVLVRFQFKPRRPLAKLHVPYAPPKAIFDTKSLRSATRALLSGLIFDLQGQEIIARYFNDLEAGQVQ